MQHPEVVNLYKDFLSKISNIEMGKGMSHPAVQIYLWICLSLLAQMLHGYLLSILAGVMAVLAFGICRSRFSVLLLRTRWILLSVLLVFSYGSPGDVLWPQLGAFSPVADGVVAGFVQTLKLTIMLAGLAMLLALLSQSQLIAGLYMLLAPLNHLGFDRERIAVRLALVLDYAENIMHYTARNLSGSIEQLLAPVQGGRESVELYHAPFSIRDWMLLAVSSIALFGVWL
ncbi:MAG: hypothetical protein WC236_13190 [Gallionellaceae bacterium]|jgi:energy-coupling factor transport system permease protein